MWQASVGEFPPQVGFLGNLASFIKLFSVLELTTDQFKSNLCWQCAPDAN